MKHGTFLGLLALSLLTSACNTRIDYSSEESLVQTPSSSVSAEDTVPEIDEQPSVEDGGIEPITYSVVKDYFFGMWTPENGDQIFIGYGDDSQVNIYSPLISAYIDESNNAVMKIMRGGEGYQYKVALSDPGTMIVSSNEIPEDVKYTKSGEAGESTDVFGYMDMLKYCIGGANADKNLRDLAESPFTLFYDTVATLDDGSSWERSATMGTPYPTLYVVEKNDDAITLRSLFYPEGSDPDSAADIAEEIVFTVSKGISEWEITSAELA